MFLSRHSRSRRMAGFTDEWKWHSALSVEVDRAAIPRDRQPHHKTRPPFCTCAASLFLSTRCGLPNTRESVLSFREADGLCRAEGGVLRGARRASGVALFDMYSGAGTYQVRGAIQRLRRDPCGERRWRIAGGGWRGRIASSPSDGSSGRFSPPPTRDILGAMAGALFPNKAEGAPAGIIDGQERLYIHESRVADDLQVAEPRPGWLTVRPIGRSFVASAPEKWG